MRVETRLRAEQISPGVAQDLVPAYAVARGMVAVALSLLKGTPPPPELAGIVTSELDSHRQTRGRFGEPAPRRPGGLCDVRPARGARRSGQWLVDRRLSRARLARRRTARVRERARSRRRPARRRGGANAHARRAPRGARARARRRRGGRARVGPRRGRPHLRVGRAGRLVPPRAGRTRAACPARSAGCARDRRCRADRSLAADRAHGAPLAPLRRFGECARRRREHAELGGRLRAKHSERSPLAARVRARRGGAAGARFSRGRTRKRRRSRPPTAVRGRRVLPTALDVGAWLGASEARAILHEAGDDAYAGYDAALEALVRGRPRDEGAARHGSVYLSGPRCARDLPRAIRRPIRCFRRRRPPSGTGRSSTPCSWRGPPFATTRCRSRAREVEPLVADSGRDERHAGQVSTSSAVFDTAPAATSVPVFVEPHPEAIGKLLALVRPSRAGPLRAGCALAQHATIGARAAIDDAEVLLTSALRAAIPSLPTTRRPRRKKLLPSRRSPCASPCSSNMRAPSRPSRRLRVRRAPGPRARARSRGGDRRDRRALRCACANPVRARSSSRSAAPFPTTSSTAPRGGAAPRRDLARPPPGCPRPRVPAVHRGLFRRRNPHNSPGGHGAR